MADMHNYSAPKPFLSIGDWFEAKEATQVTIILPDLAAEIAAALAPDFSKDGSKGLALVRSVGITLKGGDRLEHIEGGHDIWTDLTALPDGTSIHFFRPRKESRLVFWCPLIYDLQYQPEPTLNPTNLVHDILHTLDGGVAQYAGGAIFRFLIQHARIAFGVCARTKEAREKRAMKQINSEYNTFSVTPLSKELEMMPDLVLSNLVGTSGRCISAKAMQSRMLFRFAEWLIRRRQHRFIGELPCATANGLIRSAEFLTEIYTIMAAHGYSIPADSCRRATVCAKNHVVLWSLHGGDVPKPKHHALVDMCRAMGHQGNPKCHTTYVDESLNATISKLAKTVHPNHFAERVLAKYILSRVVDGKPF